MSFLEIDPFTVSAPWQVLDGAGLPSAQIALSVLPDQAHPLADATGALQAVFSPASSMHRLRRSFAAVDLTRYDQLSFWFRPDRTMHGEPEDLFRLRLRLGSIARPLDAVANTWCRYLIGTNGTGWTFAVLSIADLPAVIASAASSVEFQVTSPAGGAATVLFDGMGVARPEMVADADAALAARLHNILVLGGNPVPATLAPQLLAQPYFAITQWGQRRAWGRDPAGLRRERDDAGLILGAMPLAHDLDYRLDLHAATRAEQAAMLDFQRTRLASGWLPFGNRSWRISKIDTLAEGDQALPLPPLRYEIAAYAERPGQQRALPVTDMQLQMTAKAGG